MTLHSLFYLEGLTIDGTRYGRESGGRDYFLQFDIVSYETLLMIGKDESYSKTLQNCKK